MTLPDQSTLKAMSPKEWLVLAAQYYKNEGTSAQASFRAMNTAYGPDHVGPQLMQKATASFALADLIMRIKNAIDGPSASKEARVFANMIVHALRGAWLPVNEGERAA